MNSTLIEFKSLMRPEVVTTTGCPGSLKEESSPQHGMIASAFASFASKRPGLSTRAHEPATRLPEFPENLLRPLSRTSRRQSTDFLHVPPIDHAGGDADLAGGIGYGFGYALSPDIQITLVQEGFLSVHQRTGLDNGANTIGRQFVLRLGTRFGF